VYLIAFDLDRFDLGFAVGTEHPRVDWSDRVPDAVKDPRLPGPDPAESNLVPVLPWMPIVGLGLGLGLAAVGLLLLWVGGPAAAAVTGAMLLPGLYWWTTGAGRLTGLIDVVENWTVSGTETQRRHGVYWAMLTLHGTVACRAVLTALLIYHHMPLWLALAPVLSGAACAELIVDRVKEPNPWPLHWVAAAVVVVLIGLLTDQWRAAAFAVIVALLLSMWGKSLLKKHGLDGRQEGCEALMEMVEAAVLLAGLFFV